MTLFDSSVSSQPITAVLSSTSTVENRPIDQNDKGPNPVSRDADLDEYDDQDDDSERGDDILIGLR